MRGFGVTKYVSNFTNLRELINDVLFVLECIMEFFSRIYPKICHIEKNINKVTVSQNLRRAQLLDVGLAKNLGTNETLSMCMVLDI